MNTRALLLCVVLSGCGDTLPPPESCSASNCNGCCDANDVCQPGVTKDACGDSGNACSACEQACSASVCVSNVEPLPANAKVVFTSSLGLQGNFGGRTRADEHCNNLARAAGLTGTFAAWLSGSPSTNGASEHAKDFVTGDGPWFLVCRDGAGKLRKPFANRAALLTAPSTALDCDEKGAVRSTGVWTGTDVGGNAAPFSQCANYSVASGNSASWLFLTDSSDSVGTFDVNASTGYSTATNEQWTNAGGQLCKERLSFYCFQL